MIVCNPSPPCSYGKVATVPMQFCKNGSVVKHLSCHNPTATTTRLCSHLTLGQHFPDFSLLKLQNDCKNDLTIVSKCSSFPYIFPEIDCGNPEEQLPSGGLIAGGPSYVHLDHDSFTLGCGSGYIKEGTSELTGDDRVQCKENGRWSFGTLRCSGWYKLGESAYYKTLKQNIMHLNYSWVLEFASEYLITLKNCMIFGVFNISENFEFTRQQIHKYLR